MVRVAAAVGAAAIVLVAAAVMCTGSTEDNGRLVARMDDGSTLFEGRPSPDAIAAARSSRQGVVLWLGESFRGLNLTGAQESGGDLVLVYGACMAPPGSNEPSCVPPLAIRLAPRGAVPGLARVDPKLFRGVYRTAGETAPNADPGHSAILWLPNGWTAKLYVNTAVAGPLLEEALMALSTANHEATGLSPIGPGESLLTIPRD